MIKTPHNKIKQVSPERITLELFHLLNSNNAAKYTKMAFLDGILSDILFISDKVLEKNIRALSKLERSALKKLPLHKGGIRRRSDYYRERRPFARI